MNICVVICIYIAMHVLALTSRSGERTWIAALVVVVVIVLCRDNGVNRVIDAVVIAVAFEVACGPDHLAD